MRMRISPVAISEWDSWGWLDPALSWLGGTGFRERFEREWLYGAFIAACLRLTGSFSGYIIIQQSLGVVAAIFMWLTWRTLDGPVAETVHSRDRRHHHRSAHRRPSIFSVLSRSRSSSRFGLKGSWPSLRFSSFFVSPAIADFGGTNPEPLPPSSLEPLAMLLAYALFILKPNWLLAVRGDHLAGFRWPFWQSHSAQNSTPDSAARHVPHRSSP